MGLSANRVQAIGFPRDDRPNTEISKSGSSHPLKGCRLQKAQGAGGRFPHLHSSDAFD
ncbi:MAG: hypothetical protein ACO31I_07065 [Prochlorotrichaceae cyanobacterium]